MILLSRKGRRFVSVAVAQLPDPAQRQAWFAWARGWRLRLPFVKPPAMPPEIAEIVVSAVEHRFAYIREMGARPNLRRATLLALRGELFRMEAVVAELRPAKRRDGGSKLTARP